MPVMRLGFVVGLMISLIALTLQNQTPAISLVFLGQRSRPLALGIWLVAAIALGVLSGLVLRSILNHARQGGSPPVASRAAFRSRSAAPQSSRRASAPVNAAAPGSDWEMPATDDWGNRDNSMNDWESPVPAGRSRSKSTPINPSKPPDPRSVEAQRYARAGDPKPENSSARSRSPGTSQHRSPFSEPGSPRGSVFDAEYRVVNPPPSPPRGKDKDQDEWEEFEDEF